jgi:hypothetical protein
MSERARVNAVRTRHDPPANTGLLQRRCACGGAADLSGRCEACSKKKRSGLQTKLTVNEPGDIYEREADRVADQVVATPVSSTVSGRSLPDPPTECRRQ